MIPNALNPSKSSSLSFLPDTSTLASPQTSTIASIPTKTAASCSTTSLVRHGTILRRMNVLLRQKTQTPTDLFPLNSPISGSGISSTNSFISSRASASGVSRSNQNRRKNWVCSLTVVRYYYILFVLHSSSHITLYFQQIWSCYSVLNVLYSLIQKSSINEYLVASRQGKSEEEIT